MGHGEVRDEKPILDSVLALISVYQKDLVGLVHFGAEAFTGSLPQHLQSIMK